MCKQKCYYCPTELVSYTHVGKKQMCSACYDKHTFGKGMALNWDMAYAKTRR